MDTKQLLEGMLYIGDVSSVDPGTGMVRVVRSDKDNKVSGELAVLQRGSSSSKDYWLPAVGDQVLCLQLPNFSGKGTGDGFVLGTFYSKVDSPPDGAAAGTRVLNHPGDMIMTIGGTLTIHAGTLDIQGAGDVVASEISLKGHTHSGVETGGGSTGGPQ
jgi:phage baseplate assembly protein gpV